MSFSSSIMSGMNISLGGLELATDFLYGNPDTYEPELREVQQQVFNKTITVKPKIEQKEKEVLTRDEIMSKFDIVRNSMNNGVPSSSDEDNGILGLDDSFDYDNFNFDEDVDMSIPQRSIDEPISTNEEHSSIELSEDELAILNNGEAPVQTQSASDILASLLSSSSIPEIKTTHTTMSTATISDSDISMDDLDISADDLDISDDESEDESTNEGESTNEVESSNEPDNSSDSTFDILGDIINDFSDLGGESESQQSQPSEQPSYEDAEKQKKLAELERKKELLRRKKLLEQKAKASRTQENKQSSNSTTPDKNNVPVNNQQSACKSTPKIEDDVIKEFEGAKKPEVEAVQSSPYEIYNSMSIDKLFTVVQQFMQQHGVNKHIIDIEIVNQQFGEANIKRLIKKSYIILLGKGVTIGR